MIRPRERAAKKKPAPQYLMDKYKSGSASKSENRSQSEKGAPQFDEANITKTKEGVDATESSDDPQSVLISSKAGQKRKRSKDTRGSSS